MILHASSAETETTALLLLVCTNAAPAGETNKGFTVHTNHLQTCPAFSVALRVASTFTVILT
jgi:hypothetical protein